MDASILLHMLCAPSKSVRPASVRGSTRSSTTTAEPSQDAQWRPRGACHRRGRGAAGSDNVDALQVRAQDAFADWWRPRRDAEMRRCGVGGGRMTERKHTEKQASGQHDDPGETHKHAEGDGGGDRKHKSSGRAVKRGAKQMSTHHQRGLLRSSACPVAGVMRDLSVCAKGAKGRTMTDVSCQKNGRGFGERRFCKP